MKKSFLGILTLITLMLTVIVYINDNIKVTEVNYNLPKTNFYSHRFGKVVGIFTMPLNDTEDILILSLDKENDRSIIYSLNILDGSSSEIMKFSTHENIKDKVCFDEFGEYIMAPNKNGIVATNINLLLQGNESSVVTRTYPEFQYADNFHATRGEITYTTNNNNLIYNGNIFRQDFNESYYLNKYYKKPEKLFFKTTSSNEIYYTKINKGHKNLYMFKPNDFRGNILDKEIVENFVHGYITDLYSGIVYGLREENGRLTAFLEENLHSREIIDLCTIPMNDDSLGQVPDIFVRQDHERIKSIYTSFDKNGLGSIFLKSSIEDNPEVIVKDEFIVGKLSYIDYKEENEHSDGNRSIEMILYTSIENGELKIKLVDINDKSIKDITGLFGEVSI